MSISSIMTEDHRYCDDLFADAEAAISRGSSEARALWEAFEEAVIAHFSHEEASLFPQIEAQMGAGGPPAVMRQEHQMMRDMMHDVRERLDQGDSGAALDVADALMAMIQQHNMKEEHVLYPMLDRVCEQVPAADLASQKQGVA